MLPVEFRFHRNIWHRNQGRRLSGQSPAKPNLNFLAGYDGIGKSDVDQLLLCPKSFRSTTAGESD